MKPGPIWVAVVVCVVLGALFAISFVKGWRRARASRVNAFEIFGEFCEHIGAEFTPHARLVLDAKRLGMSLDAALEAVACAIVKAGRECPCYQVVLGGSIVRCGLFDKHGGRCANVGDDPECAWMDYGLGSKYRLASIDREPWLSALFPNGIPATPASADLPGWAES